MQTTITKTYQRTLNPQQLIDWVSEYESIMYSKKPIDQGRRVELKDELVNRGYFDGSWKSTHRDWYFKSSKPTRKPDLLEEVTDLIFDSVDETIKNVEKVSLSVNRSSLSDTFLDPDPHVPVPGTSGSVETGPKATRKVKLKDYMWKDSPFGIELHDRGGFLCRMHLTKKKPNELTGFKSRKRHAVRYLKSQWLDGWCEFLCVYPWTIGLGVVDIDEEYSDGAIDRMVNQLHPLFITRSRSGKFHLWFPSKGPHRKGQSIIKDDVKIDLICQTQYVGIYQDIKEFLPLIDGWLDDGVKPEGVQYYEEVISWFGRDLPPETDPNKPNPVRFQDYGPDSFAWPEKLKPVYDGNSIIGWYNEYTPWLEFISRTTSREDLQGWVSRAVRGQRAKTIAAALYNLAYQIQDRSIYNGNLDEGRLESELVEFAETFDMLLDRSESDFTKDELISIADFVVKKVNGRGEFRLMNFRTHLTSQENLRLCAELKAEGLKQKEIAYRLGLSVDTIKRYYKKLRAMQ